MSENKPKGVFVIIERDSLERPFFRRVGTAFVNRDSSLNVYLDAVPLSGRLHIREVERPKPGRGHDWSGRPEGDLGVDRSSVMTVEQV